jgi:hypothetical protein
MPEKPLILFPRYENSERSKGSGGPLRFSKPSIGRQMQRLSPKFEQLQRAIQQKNISIQQSPLGINPECALVLEVIGSVDSFYTVIKNIDGLELMFDTSLEGIEQDDDFKLLNTRGNIKEDGDLSGKVYCVMTNKRAIDELISLWRQYANNPEMQFQRGYTGLRDMFKQLKDIRYWSPKDRFEETHVLDYWRENLEFDGDRAIKFEIELFFRNKPEHRANAANIVREVIGSMNGKVISQCVITEIAYHCLLVELPRNQIELLVKNYEQIELANVDDVMFFRPVGQIAFPIEEETSDNAEFDETLLQECVINEEPIIAIFDGFPIQNHSLLSGRIIIDDPDEWGSVYTVKDRVHGTAMASLVIHSDLNKRETALDRKVYIRPILKPTRDFNNTLMECVPEDVIIVDLIHIAVKRIFEGDETTEPVAPTVRIINLSLGDPCRQFYNLMSPLARLLDWLSYKYKVLFIVSAGNHNRNEIDVGITFSQFKELPIEKREEAVIKAVEQNSRNMRLLSPSESINSLTVGALFKDSTQIIENDRFILPYQKTLPSPISAVGLGYNRSIKPDIFFDGGRKFLKESLRSSGLEWVNSITRPPGCCVATPGTDEGTLSIGYTFGTSDATAQVTHEGAKCHSVLNDIFLTQIGQNVPQDYAAILIKSMLVHGASWGDNALIIANSLQISDKRVFRWLGNGVPDISKVEECAKNRITLIGYGSLEKDKAHVYQLPLPFDFSTGRYFRKLTITLSYFSTTKATRQRYRSAQVWFSIENNILTPNRVNTDDKSVKRGTIQHEIFYGDSAIVWEPNNYIDIKVNCKDDAEKYFKPVNYGLFVTFEVAEEVAERLNMDIYTDVVSKIREAVPVTTVNSK